MPSYNYKCNDCSYEYNEVREEDQPQWFIKCPAENCNGILEE